MVQLVKMGKTGRTFNWIDLFRLRWDQLSNRYNVDNATTEIGPIILSIMINDVYSNMNCDIRSLFVQDGALRKRGRIEYSLKKRIKKQLE